MGTRHLQVVIDKDGNDKIRQYGQWDGYPSGQGKDILTFLKKNKDKMEQYHNNLVKIPLITEEQIDTVDKIKNWDKAFPYLSRDCGSNIHQLILDGEVKFVQHIEQKEAEKWCEGFYTIDFQKNLFIAEYYGIKKEYPLDKLPTVNTFLKDFKTKE